MKIRLYLVALIILAQLGWLSVRYFLLTDELEAAPRIIVKADLARYSTSPRMQQFYDDFSLLGKSIWWDTAKWEPIFAENLRNPLSDQDDANNRRVQVSLANRPMPGDDVQGAIELLPASERLIGTRLSALWTQGEDGIWTFRLEAPGSSEDVLREGELRSTALVRPELACSKAGGIYDVHLRIQPFVPEAVKSALMSRKNDVVYLLNDDDARDLQAWLNAHTQEVPKSLPCTIEIALREEGSRPIAVQTYINGTPIHEAITRMKNGTFALPKVEPVPQPQEEETPTEPAPLPSAE